MRARLALMHCGAQCELREVVLKNKPTHMLELSSKGTVPVLAVPTESKSQTTNYRVIDQSIDIMHWAMSENPTRHLPNANEWLIKETLNIDKINTLIKQNDFEFKNHLDKYKYSDRHPEYPQAHYLEQAMPFLEKLESILANSPYLGGSQFRFADAAILPFIRQFSMVKPNQFNTLALPKLQQWLARGLNSELFISMMVKNAPWEPGASENVIVFGKG